MWTCMWLLLFCATVKQTIDLMDPRIGEEHIRLSKNDKL